MDTFAAALDGLGASVIATLGFKDFDTLADMQADTGESWRFAKCNNYLPGDQIVTLWINTSDDPSIIPNGTNIIEIGTGGSALRFSTTELALSTSIAVPGSTYTVSVPVVFEDLTNFRASNISAPLVILVADANNEYGLFLKGGSPTGTDGVDYVTNAAGITYTRL